jgi:hypothetical protein
MLPINDNEAFNIRANAGDGPDCDVNPVEPLPLAIPLPPEIPCDDPPEPDIETFFNRRHRQLQLGSHVYRVQ